MRLKSIKLAGFKSFVDPTTVDFPSNLAAVVGPNGCGKSNIIDAVRWVLGESSAKNLRGEAMTDVIFNGSSGRKPVGQASIELIFDNSDGTIVGEYAGYSEIAIRRKVTREGQNFYYLNGTKCRRRDITDIFLGTGLGPRSYAIIEQGMISRLIEAKPEELRVYIEEAAGISKYKERRRETENRMRRTNENLERLTDIREELERQISRLERQAQSAEKYKDYKAHERELKSQLQALKYRTLQQQSEIKHAAISTLELQVESGVTESVSHESNIEKYRNQYTELSDRFNVVQGNFYAIGTDIARIEQSMQHAKERERQLKIDLDQTERDCREAQEHQEADKHKAKGWQAELFEIEPELDLIKESEEESASVLIEAEEAMLQWQQDWDQFNQKAAQPKQKAEVQQSRIQYFDQIQQRLISRIDKLESERNDLVDDGVSEEIAEFEEQLATDDLDMEEMSLKLEQLSERLGELRDTEQKNADQRDGLRAELQSCKGCLASLETLQQAALGRSGDAVNEWLQSQGLADYPRVAEKITVTDGWDLAVETVLGKSLQAVACPAALSELASFEMLESLDSGELMLMAESDTPTVAAKESLGILLANHVDSTVDLTQWLQGIYIADDLPAAMAMQGALASGESVVTRDGIWLGQNWLRVAKDADASSGVIARQQELESVQNQVQTLEERLQKIDQAYKDAKQSLKDVEAQREQHRRGLDSASRRHAEARSQLSSRKAKAEQIIQARERSQRDIVEAKAQLDIEVENLCEARQELEEAISLMERDAGEREDYLSKRDRIRAELDDARQKARHDKDKAHELAMRTQSIKTQLQSIHQGMQRLEEQSARMLERKEALLLALAEYQEPAEEQALELEGNLEKRIAIEKRLQEARKAVEAAETGLRDVEQQRTKVEQVVAGIRQQLESARLEAQTLDVQKDGLKQQLIDDDFDLDEVLASLDETLTESGVEEALEAVAKRVSRLGAINLAAIDEFTIESERKQYLDSQNDDLREALDILEGAIKKIDRETRTRFKETFDQVNSGIQELFPKVFGGGHAYLELTGEDLLDTGIAIMARPPGKKNSTIHLLSGGEKALTAIALVFSIFRLNPAPFCMLDEVDAPLDDANVGRYARMVEEMSEHVQFIYITHNKIAMEMAHQLLGVTMHEPGVSRMVTVDVEEAAELASM
ncbi:MAG: chromosome segregation protein SMC [Alteromonadaceae bacterium]|nr:MAG: chromosome segregation protein SMC [Alteromonadaceae bacterium]